VLYFAFGTDTLTVSSTQSVQQILAEIVQRPAPEILIMGYADQVGTTPYNETLSLQRAERVKQDLIQHGVAANAIETIGRGKSEATGDDARDRRVEIVVR
jgi:OOP family OmpA-OmpF porin